MAADVIMIPNIRLGISFIYVDTYLFTGYIRNEWKFESVDALIERIHLDIETGKAELDKLKDYETDKLFSSD